MDILNSTIGQGVGAGLGLLLGDINDRRQIRQQEKLQRMQIAGQKELGQFNQDLAYQMWLKTNYDAQRREMEKAGLNIGLMYKGAGAGGTTQGGSAGTVTGGQAPVGGGEVGMGMQLGLATALQKAQIENINADTEKKKVEAGKTAGIDTAVASTEMEALKQEIKNEEIRGRILTWEEQQKIIETNIADKNQYEAIHQMKINTKKLQAEMDTAVTQSKITKESADAIIKTAKMNNVEQGIRMALMKSNITKTEIETEEAKQKIKKMATEIMAMEVGLSFEARKTRVQEIATGWQFGDDATTKRNVEGTKTFVNIITDIIEAFTE